MWVYETNVKFYAVKQKVFQHINYPAVFNGTLDFVYLWDILICL